MHGKSRVLPAVLAVLLVATAGLVQVAGQPLPPNSNAYGKGYDGLAADWVEWITAIPFGNNPLFDPDGTYAAVGQSGHAWFLVGNTTGGATTRTITVPSGTALFFPIVNYFWVNTPEYGDAPWSPEQEALARSILEFHVDTANNLVLEIDGKTVRNVDGLRVSSTVGACTLPTTDNIFGVPLVPGPHECLADGYWALIPPMSVGEHEIHFGGGLSSVGFSLDVTYHVIVKPRQKLLW